MIYSVEIHAMERNTLNSQPPMTIVAMDSYTKQLKGWESEFKTKKTSQTGQEMKARIVGLINSKMKTGELPTKNKFDTEAGKEKSKNVVEMTKYLLKFVLGNSEAIPSKEQDPTNLFQRIMNYYDEKSGQHWNEAELSDFEQLEPSFSTSQIQPSKIVNLQQIPSLGKSMTENESNLFVDQLKGWYESYNQDRESPEGKEYKAKIISLINSKMQTGEFPTQKDEWGNGVLQHVTYLLKLVLANSENEPTPKQDPTNLFKRVINYYEGNPGQHWRQDEIEPAIKPYNEVQPIQPQPINSPILQNSDKLTPVLNIQTDQKTYDTLQNSNTGGGKISANIFVFNFGMQAAQQALDTLKMEDYSLIPVKEQGYNSVTFDLKDKTNYFVSVVKVARGEGELEKLSELRDIFTNKLGIDLSSSNDILQKRGLIGISIPQILFSLSVNGQILPKYSIQIMNYIRSDANFGIILKRLLGEGNKFWVETSLDKWQDFLFDKGKDLELMKFFGQAFGRFQRGGKVTDNQIPNMTLIHGDLFLDHVLVTDYKLENTGMQNVNPKFSLIDIGTMEYVPDLNCYMLLVDPMFFSSVVFVDFKKKNFRQGTLDVFNNFYLGYVGEFSEKTLNKLLEMYQNSDSAYQSFLQAAKHAKSIDREMKTAQSEHFKLSPDDRVVLEKQLADLHRLSFLYAYYKVVKKDENMAGNILKEEVQWKQTWEKSNLFQKLGMESEK